MKKTLKEVMTLPNLKAWLETKDPAEKYPYGDSSSCLLQQFLNGSGYPIEWVGAFLIDGEPFPRIFDAISLDSMEFRADHSAYDWTFGGALKRCNQAINRDP